MGLISITGVLLMVGLRFMPILRLPYGVRMMLAPSDQQAEGDISSFQALMTSLAATVGTGNIAGVAGAIAIGGPGAVFWMWLIAFFGIATKYAEAVLAVKFRETDGSGNHVGGPMYYIRNGLGSQWSWLAGLFALFGMLAGFGIGNGVQAFEVSSALESAGVPRLITGVVLGASGPRGAPEHRPGLRAGQRPRKRFTIGGGLRELLRGPAGPAARHGAPRRLRP